MGFASTPPTVLVKKEVERLTGQHSESSQTITNLSSPTTRTVLAPSEDEKRLFPDFEVGSDAEVIITPSNIRLKENMRSSFHNGAFKPVNTLSGANLLDYGHHNIPKTYGKNQLKRLRTENTGGDDMAASDEPWDLHSAEVLASKKPKSEKAVVISDDEGEIEMLSAAPKTRTSGRPKNMAPPRVSQRTQLSQPSGCETHPVSGRIPEYQSIEKQMTVPGGDAHHSGKINSRVARDVTSMSRVSDNPRASRAFLAQSPHSDKATDTVIAKDQLKQPNNSVLKGSNMVGNMFRSSNGKRNGVNEEFLSKQTHEEIFDDEEPVETWKSYTGTAFQSKPTRKATNQTLPSRSMKPTRTTLQTGTSSRHFAGNARSETQPVENPSETRKARHTNTGSVFGRLDPNTPQNARDTFKRVEDPDDSPDILLSSVNVGDIVPSKSRIRDRMTTNQDCKSDPSSPPEIVPDPQLSLPSSPADIRGTQFTEGRQSNRRQSLVGTRNSKQTEGAQFKIRMLDSGVTPQLGQLNDTSAYNLIFDSTANTLVSCACDSREAHLCSCEIRSIPIKKTLRIFHSEDDGCLVELQLPRDGVPIDTAFVQLYQAGELSRFVQAVQGVSNCGTVQPKPLQTMLKRYTMHCKKKEGWKSRLHERPSEQGLDQHAQFLQDKKKDQRKSRRLDGLSDTELSSKRQRVEPNEGSLLTKRDLTRRLREQNDYIQDSNHDNPHETRSKSRLDRKPQLEEWQDTEEIRSNISAAQKESKFLILKREIGKEWQKPLVYPSDGPRKTTVDFNDLERLDEGEFLNDNIIAFYLRYLERQLELSDPDNAKRIYFFNTFFYERLTRVNTGKQGINYEGVQKWTSKIDIFDFDYIVVPVNESAHWYVTIICNLPNLARTLGGEEPSAPADGFITDVIVDDGSDGGPVLSTERSSPRLSPQPKEIGTDQTYHKAPTEDQIDLNSLDQSDTAVRTPNMDANHEVETVSNEPINVDGGEDAEWPDDEENQLDHPSSKPGSKTTCVVELGSVAPKTDNAGTRKDGSQIKANPQNKQKKAKRRVSLRKYEVNDPIIITLDSLGLPHNITARNLKEYLIEEGKTKRRLNISIESIAGMNSKEIPLQDNYCDCGVFLLGYIERFLQNPRAFVNRILRREMDKVDDWSELDPSNKRNQLRELILQLYDQQDNASKGGARSKGKHHKNRKLVSEKNPEDVVANRKEHYKERSDVSPLFHAPVGTEAKTVTDVARPENDPGKEESLIVLSSNPIAGKNVSKLEEENHIVEVVENSNRSEEALHESSETPIEVSALDVLETQESDFPSVEEIVAQEMERPHEHQKRRIESRQEEVPSRTQPSSRSERKQRTLISLDD